MQAVVVRKLGGPEVLDVVDVPPPTPEGRAILVDVTVSGVNFVDIYFRRGGIPVELPLMMGLEGAGRVAALGPGVSEFSVGDRVGWAVARGSYGDQVLVDVDAAIRLPDGISEETAAAVLLQGITAHYLTTDTYPVGPNDTALVHAAGGGVGQLVTQMVKLRGGRVIATASNERKAEVAARAGADHVIRYDSVDFVSEVRRLTSGAGVDVVFDGVGRATYEGSVACLRRRGFLVAHGAASGPVGTIDLEHLRNVGSLFVTRPSLVDHRASRDELVGRATDVLRWVEQGQLRVNIGARYARSDVRQAHADLENRRTVGKVLLC